MQRSSYDSRQQLSSAGKRASGFSSQHDGSRHELNVDEVESLKKSKLVDDQGESQTSLKNSSMLKDTIDKSSADDKDSDSSDEDEEINIKGEDLIVSSDLSSKCLCQN